MPGFLAPDVRVWIGWTAGADENVRSELLQKGTIYDGPFPPGMQFIPWPEAFPMVNMQGENLWLVIPDHRTAAPAPVRIAVESILTPIDDGDEYVETTDEKTETV